MQYCKPNKFKPGHNSNIRSAYESNTKQHELYVTSTNLPLAS